MCAPKVKTPDTSKQEAEAQRQRELEQQRFEQQLAQQQRIADEQRAATEEAARQERELLTGQLQLQSLSAQRAESQRRDSEAAAAAESERQRQQAEAEAATRAANAKAYSEGRTNQINSVTQGIDEAYSGFDDNYFTNFAKQYVDYYTPQIADQFKNAREGVTYKYANQGGVNSSAAIKDMAELVRKRKLAEGKIAQDSSGAAASFRGDIDSQRKNLLGEALAAVNIGPDVLPDGVSDVTGSLNNITQKLAPYAALAKSRASGVAAPSYSDLGSLFGDLSGGSASGGSTGTFSNLNSDGIYQPRSGSSVRVVV